MALNSVVAPLGQIIDWQVRPLHLMSVNFYDFAELLVSLSDDVFERRTSTGSRFFHFGRWFYPNFGQIASIIGKTQIQL